MQGPCGTRKTVIAAQTVIINEIEQVQNRLQLCIAFILYK